MPSRTVFISYARTDRAAVDQAVDLLRAGGVRVFLDVTSIGAGGGSIAWFDVTNTLKVGPKSAGAEPGPICYDRGGHEPTVTDANLVLGYLNPTDFCGGTMRLRTDGVREAIAAQVGRPLGLDAVEAVASMNLRERVRFLFTRRLPYRVHAERI